MFMVFIRDGAMPEKLLQYTQNYVMATRLKNRK